MPRYTIATDPRLSTLPNNGTNDMTTTASHINARQYLYVAVAAFVALSAVLLWYNDQQKQDLQNLEHRLYNAQVEIRVLQAEKIFGTPFIAPFSALDQHGQPATLPDLGKEHTLFLFFASRHHPLSLDLMSSFGSVIGDNVPVIGIVQAGSFEEITPIVEKFRFRFPVYLAVDSPFDLPNSPHSVLVDGVGNVLHLSPIEGFDTQTVEGQISELTQIVRRLESAVQPDLTVRWDPTVQPDQKADQLADEKSGVYRPHTVDTKAEIIYHPPIPDGVVDLNFNGDVVIQLVVGTNGNVDTTFVAIASGRADVDTLMMEVARKVVYTPAVHDGERVMTRELIPFMFRTRGPTPDEETVTEE